MSLLFGAPDELFYVREIARQIETSVGTVQRELTLLDVIELRDYCLAIGVELRTFIDALEKDITQATTVKASQKVRKRSLR